VGNFAARVEVGQQMAVIKKKKKLKIISVNTNVDADVVPKEPISFDTWRSTLITYYQCRLIGVNTDNRLLLKKI
jgi:hypothetical protein